MATSMTKNDNTMRKPRPQLPPRFVPRVIVVKKGYQGPSKECSIEYNSIQKEMRSLFSGFSNDKKVIAMRRVTSRIGEYKRAVIALLKRASQMKMTHLGVSYSQIARVNATPTLRYTSSPISREDKRPYLSRYEAKRDYTRAHKAMLASRQAAYELVCAMAARHPRVVRKSHDEASLVRGRELRAARTALNRERKYLARHPAREVESFPLGCSYSELEIYENRSQASFVEVRRPLARSPKSIRHHTPKWSMETEKSVLNNPWSAKDTSARLSVEVVHFLLFKLRMIIRKFRDREGVEFIYRRILTRDIKDIVKGQMEEEGEVQTTITEQSKQGNIVIASSEPPVRAPSHDSTLGFSRLAVSVQRQTFNTIRSMTDRWIKVIHFDWSSGEQGDTLTYRAPWIRDNQNYIHFPSVILQQFQDTPNAQVFLNHRLFRSDMRIRLVMNSSPWQIGAVVAVWTYGHYSDNGPINNLYSALQRNHAILQAGCSNDVELFVPYHHFNAYLSNSSKECYTGYLTLYVLSRLTVTSQVARNAGITVYVSFENTQAHALITRNLGIKTVIASGIQGQMETVGALCNAADFGVKAIRTVTEAFNRDNPPYPLQPGSLIPQTMSSFAFTDHIPEPINVLRADPRGQRPPCINTREMTVQFLTQGWGYYTKFSWSFSNTVDEELLKIDVSPISEGSVYPRVATTTGYTAAYYPPLAVASSLAGKYRGDIEYKFFVVANSFYTGSLAISVVPLNGDQSLIAREANRSGTEVFDVRKASEMIVRAPWNWYNAWAKVRGLYNGTEAFARLYVHVVNPLVGINTVPSSLEVIVFIRGSDNFELCQMRTPLLGLNTHAIKPPSDEYLHPYNFETKWYQTTNRRAVDSKGRYFYTPYIQNVTDGFVGYTNVEPGVVYRLNTVMSDGVSRFRWQITSQERYFATYYPGYSTSNAQGIVLFNSLRNAIDFLKAVKENTINKYFDDENHRRDQWVKDSEWSQVLPAGKGTWIVENLTNVHPILSKVPVEIETEYVVVGQMDTEGESVIMTTPSGTSLMGTSVYGEAMPDLKGLNRRWQYCGSIVAKTCNEPLPQDCLYFCKVPVRPARDFDPKTSRGYNNRMREGAMTVVNSGYYLWDGSMRYRIIPVKSVPQDTIMYVQHRFDDNQPNTKIVTPTLAKDHVSARALMDTHYATYAQALSVNPVVTVEVPYYRETDRVLTVVSGMKPSTNGHLYVWLHSATVGEVQLEIYHSLGDDFQWSVFQGFPAMMDISQFTDEPTGQMDEEGLVCREDELFFIEDDLDFDHRPRLKTYWNDDGNVRPTPPEGQGLVDTILHPVTSAVRTSFESIANHHRDNFDITIQNVGSAAEQLTTNVPKVTEAFEKLSTKMSSFIDKVGKLPENISDRHKEHPSRTWMEDLAASSFDYITHIVYCMINQNGATVGWAICNIYRNVWGFSLNGVEKLMQPIQSLWDRVSQPTQQPQVVGQMEDTDISSLCSLLYCSMCSLLRVSLKPPTSWTNVCEGLFKFSESCRGASLISAFIRDNLTLLRRIWNCIMGYFSIGSASYKLIAGIEDNRLKQWFVHVAGLLNPSMREKIYTNPLWAEKVFELGMSGRAFSLACSMEKSTPVALIRLMTDYLRELKKLEEELINRKVFCGERYEPFCLWIHGKAGSGKTRLLQSIAVDLADLMKVPCAQTYHTVTFGQQYFDGFCGQPSVLIDDFLAVDPLQDGVSSMFVQMKSSALFNPPYSDVKDKAKLVNFYNLLVSSNFSGVKNTPGIHDNDAYNRRRDLVLEMIKDQPFPENWEEMSPEERNLFYSELKHCTIWWSPNSMMPEQGKMKIERVEGESYYKTVQKFIMKRASEYHSQEANAYKQRSFAKIARLEKFSEQMSVQDYLDKITPIFDPDCSSRPSILKDVFSVWSSPQKEDLEKYTEAPKGQMESEYEDSLAEIHPRIPKIKPWETYWPYVEGESTVSLASMDPGVVYQPMIPEDPVRRNCSCLHRQIKNVHDYFYDPTEKCFVRTLTPFASTEARNTPESFPVQCCWMKMADGSLQALPDCLMFSSEGIQFKANLVTAMLGDMTAYAPEFPNITRTTLKEFEESGHVPLNFPFEILSEVQTISKVNLPTLAQASFDNQRDIKKLAARVESLQAQLKEKTTPVGDHILPKRPRWQRITLSIWNGFLAVCRFIGKVFFCLERVLAMAAVFTATGVFGMGLYHSFATKPQLHASGDYKTMRTKTNFRGRALQITKPSGHVVVDGIKVDDVTDAALLKICKEQFIDPSADGRLRRIVGNVFTLCGLAPTKGEKVIIYRVRCIGLRDYRFICLRHYIEHFKARGVKTVAVVRHKGIGMQRYSIDSIDFQWTSGGYGVGTLPTLAQPFANITKYIPSESFDGAYPATMAMVEVTVDDVRIKELDCARIKLPLRIPQNKEQSPWMIDQGFTYSWGGAGKCGSFLFAPQLACPFVGIHTAGVETRIGYSELLFRETFVPEEEPEVDFVVPQMEYNDNGFDLPGDGHILGHLPPEKAISLPNKTKIVESDIHGVFPVKTEPAPLSGRDERLPRGVDPLVEGIRKRCDPPIDFPSDVLQDAHIDLYKTLLVNVKPLRDPVALTVTEAVEGLTLEGYDPLEITTSEGYPWTLDRPKSSSNKSWMFKFSTYPDGRRRLEGVFSKLADTLDMKNRMREKGVIPVTYYTACLKDARIAKEKVSVPGKTRVFEMSPVDLTISQRQYFLDFYAAYQKARLNAENTIGINPDGPEWTDLADRLRNFSPYILTADYSGYGPRLLMSVQFKAYLTEIGWYEHWQTKYNHTEEQLDTDFRIRYSMLYEMLHPATVVKDAVVRFNTGMPSGNAGTVIKNSECNSLYIRVVYILLARRHAVHYSDMMSFHRFVLMFSNGDDLIISVKEDIIEWFNNQTIIEEFAKFNIKMTDALKQGVTRRYCSLEEATYLKRGFMRHPYRDGQWLAPLEEASITDTANWIWKCADPRTASLVNSEMSCRLAYTRGPEYYNSIVTTISNRWLMEGIVFRAPSWQALDLHFWENAPGPAFQFL